MATLTQTWTSESDFDDGAYVDTEGSGDEIALDGTEVGNWVITADLNTARRQGAGAGTVSSALSFGGAISGDTYDETTEEFNGTSWSAGGDLATGRNNLGGAGTQSAGLSFGGYTGSNSNVTEEYNGTSWSGGGNCTALRLCGGCGTQSAGLKFHGHPGGAPFSKNTEEYNGSSWSAGGGCVDPVCSVGSAGTQSAALSMAGTSNGTKEVLSEEYNGSTWTSGGDLSTGRYQLSGFGTQTDGLAVGGHTGAAPLSSAETYNGAAWSSANSISQTARTAMFTGGGAAASSGGLINGGLTNNDGTAYDTQTEEYYVSGTWTINFDSGNPEADWSNLTMSKTTPASSSVVARARVADTEAGLSAASWLPASSYWKTFPVAAPGLSDDKRWLQLEVTLRSGGGGDPTVQDVSIDYVGAAAKASRVLMLLH